MPVQTPFAIRLLVLRKSQLRTLLHAVLPASVLDMLSKPD